MRIMAMNFSDWGFFCSTMEFKNFDPRVGWGGGGRVGAVKPQKHHFEGLG